MAALGAGALPALAFPRANLWWLAYVALVPLLQLVRAAGSAREAAVRTWVGAAAFFLAMHHWLLPNVGPFAPLVASLLGSVWMPWAVLAWRPLFHPVSRRRLAAAMAVLPSTWVVGEVVRSWEHLGGPWAILGTTQWSNRAVLDLAALGGVWAISFLLVAVNVALAVAVGATSRAPVRVAALLGAGLLLGATAGWAGVRAAPEPVGTVVVAGVQPGVTSGVAPRFRAHEEATRRLRGAGANLVVWGESSVGLDPTARPEYLRRLVQVARDAGADVLVNVDAQRARTGIFKTSLLVSGEGVQGRYDKMRLVPFGEYIPLRPFLGWVGGVTEAADEDRWRGSDLLLLRSGELDIGPLVCFESAFPDLSRLLARRGADLIVVQSATTTFQGTWAQPQHASLAAVRAVESGRPVVHAAMSGVSAVFGADGRRLAWVESDRRTSYVVRVPVTTGATPYVRLGEWVPVGSLAVVVACAVTEAARRVARRRSRVFVTTVE